MFLKQNILSKRNRERGFGLFDLLLAMTVVLIMIVPVIELSDKWLTEYRVRILADRLGVIDEAVNSYLDHADNWQSVYADTRASSGVWEFDIASLEGLPPGFRPNGLPFSKTAKVFFRIPRDGIPRDGIPRDGIPQTDVLQDNILEFIVFTSGGRVLNEALLSVATTRGHANYGYVATRNPDTLLSTIGQYDLTPWDIGGTVAGNRPSQGNIGIVNSRPRNAVLADFLYRSEVPGFSEANRMNTDLLMGDGSQKYDIRNVATITAQSMETETNISVGGNLDVTGDMTVTGNLEGQNLQVRGTAKASSIDVSSLLRTNTLEATGTISANELTAETVNASINISGAQAQFTGNVRSQDLTTEVLQSETLESAQGSLGFIQGETVKTDILTVGDANVSRHIDSDSATIETGTIDTLFVDNCNGC